MKTLIFIVLIALAAGQYYSNQRSSVPNVEFSELQSQPKVAKQTVKKAVNYRCDGRQHCSQMRTYEEAKFFLDNCPDTKMDGDMDGIPCERQFNR
ncbi:excalibur calcium-binding domain-containing protein [Vibrio gangliei]|uniref:excalibur calcium-binding domain-containing protein n=1 Tax=Vibrio gangliei TaxID=2077090 RepID=UPI000D01ABD8|nr:excalibur calcium-binding domain-containing protein [Vibrio gangliei]